MRLYFLAPWSTSLGEPKSSGPEVASWTTLSLCYVLPVDDFSSLSRVYTLPKEIDCALDVFICLHFCALSFGMVWGLSRSVFPPSPDWVVHRYITPGGRWWQRQRAGEAFVLFFLETASLILFPEPKWPCHVISEFTTWLQNLCCLKMYRNKKPQLCTSEISTKPLKRVF